MLSLFLKHIFWFINIFKHKSSYKFWLLKIFMLLFRKYYLKQIYGY